MLPSSPALAFGKARKSQFGPSKVFEHRPYAYSPQIVSRISITWGALTFSKLSLLTQAETILAQLLAVNKTLYRSPAYGCRYNSTNLCTIKLASDTARLNLDRGCIPDQAAMQLSLKSCPSNVTHACTTFDCGNFTE